MLPDAPGRSSAGGAPATRGFVAALLRAPLPGAALAPAHDGDDERTWMRWDPRAEAGA